MLCLQKAKIVGIVNTAPTHSKRNVLWTSNCDRLYVRFCPISITVTHWDVHQQSWSQMNNGIFCWVCLCSEFFDAIDNFVCWFHWRVADWKNSVCVCVCTVSIRYHACILIKIGLNMKAWTHKMNICKSLAYNSFLDSNYSCSVRLLVQSMEKHLIVTSYLHISKFWSMKE